MNSSKTKSEAAESAIPVNPSEIDETRWERIAANLKTIGGAVLLALVIRTCLFEAFEIEGPSMEPTLLNGDRVVVAKFLYGLFLPFRDAAELNWGGPEVGDVVIIKSPADGVDIVKRVIGVGGDTIEVHSGRVYRNGEVLPEEDIGSCTAGNGGLQRRCHRYQSKVGDWDFVISRSSPGPGSPPIDVPPGHIFVLGDHRDASNDSRNMAVGAIPISRIKGKALSVYWSRDQGGTRWQRMFHNVQ
ncbi:MAG: signal peptidase I [Myxococcales bacterium]|nr:signal peptidase I [Myxococcales bacterium]